jgi:hypothetical protein
MYDALLLNEFEIQLDNLPDLASLLLFPSLRTLRCEALDFCENPFGVSRYRKVADLSQWLADHSRSSIWEVYLNNCHVPDEKTLLEFMTFVPDLSSSTLQLPITPWAHTTTISSGIPSRARVATRWQP